MSVILIILTVIAVIIITFLVAAAIMPRNMVIERSITIARPKQEIFEFVKYVKNHDNFSVWAMMDPDMKKEYRGTDGQPGFVYAWDSNKVRNVGAGEQEIKKIDEGRSIEHELRFIRPMQDVANARFTFDAQTANDTKVGWGFYSKMKFPMNAMMPMISGMLSKQLEKGLSNLKNFLEK